MSLLETILNAPAMAAISLLVLLGLGYGLLILKNMSASLSGMGNELKELRKDLADIALEVREHRVRIQNLEERE